ncbi:MAG: F510_1955 family glycosylhydrolase [Chloroflexota bacterium]
MTKKRSTTKETKSTNLINGGIATSALVVFVVFFGLWYFSNRSSNDNTQNVQFPHMHGMGFSSDGGQLFVTAHDGFRVYENGHWLVPNLPINDYMGYSPTNSGFYSSGHPGSASNQINPLGLVKSTDGGQTITALGFVGESDFHLMGVGYETHAIFVLNPEANAILNVGLSYSIDDGKTWHPRQAGGVTSNIIQIAVHPTQENIVALATEGGLFLSTDYGQKFSHISNTIPVTSASFAATGDRLLFAYQNLYANDLTTGKIDTLQSPTITGSDAISYITVNPVSGAIAIATLNKDIYMSNDQTQTWKQIAQRGIGKS